jgi:predicted component of type VI protein secretion system
MDELGYYEEGAHEKEEGYHKEGAHEKEEGHGRMMMMKERDIESEFFSEEERLDEMVEVDIAELMSEIRRAKKIMSLRESRKNDRLRKQKLQESHLKKIIQKEVENILQEMSEHSRFEKKQAVRKSLRLRNTIPGLGFKK